MIDWDECERQNERRHNEVMSAIDPLYGMHTLPAWQQLVLIGMQYGVLALVILFVCWLV